MTPKRELGCGGPETSPIDLCSIKVPMWISCVLFTLVFGVVCRCDGLVGTGTSTVLVALERL
jgi:hypothetical protein